MADAHDLLIEAAEFLRNGTPIRPGSLLANAIVSYADADGDAGICADCEQPTDGPGPHSCADSPRLVRCYEHADQGLHPLSSKCNGIEV